MKTVGPKDHPPRLGAKLRHARVMLGLSLAEVGERVGLTEGYMSKLENNRSIASMATLHRLVTALGINMSELFAPASGDDGVITVIPKNNRTSLVTGHHRAGNQVTLERLVPGTKGQLLQINIHVIAPGGGSVDPISHEGQEFGYVLSGSVELSVLDRRIELHEGDGFYFDSSHPHSYRNGGEAEARILWVNTPPTF